MTEIGPQKLLGPNDPPPIEVINEGSDYPAVLVCEHAGRVVPKSLRSLGLRPNAFDLHIAWDIGTDGLSRALAERLGATAILQPYSRLVIDCNRPTHVKDAMPEVSDHIEVPRNIDLSGEARRARIDEIFLPFQRTVDGFLDQRHVKAAFSIHSFTPVMDGFARPWDIGFLYRKDDQTSHQLAARIAEQDPNLTIGFNQPYQICDISDWFVPQHAERRSLPHSLIEVRNDHLDNDQAIADWADRLGNAINAFAKTI
ncbi:MAG: N-formylglutamate amidohydrolase [Geminicoccaceae bacterium]